MRYDIKKNWLAAFDLISTRPIVILPFIIIAFLEALALEFIYFLPRKPILLAAGPIIRKFFGEGYLHYPNNLLALPRLFYYAQASIYIFVWALLAAVSIKIVKNIRAGLPLKLKAIIKNVAAKYQSFFFYGIIIIILIGVIKKADTLIFSKYAQLIERHVPQIVLRLAPLQLTLFLFISNIVMQAFMLFALPIIVIQKKSLLRSLGGSIYIGIRKFFTVFKLISLPFLLYLPMAMLRGVLPKLVNRTFPEITIVITVAGIITAIFVDSFVTVCATQFFLDYKGIYIPQIHTDKISDEHR